MKKFELYWREVNIGSLVETNWDMRSFGIISLKLDSLPKTFENERLADFINHTIKASILIEEGDEEGYDELIKIEEIKFLDLINTTDWYLVDDKDEKIIILCPIFHEDNGVTWMIDIEATESLSS